MFSPHLISAFNFTLFTSCSENSSTQNSPCDSDFGMVFPGPSQLTFDKPFLSGTLCLLNTVAILGRLLAQVCWLQVDDLIKDVAECWPQFRILPEPSHLCCLYVLSLCSRGLTLFGFVPTLMYSWVPSLPSTIKSITTSIA